MSKYLLSKKVNFFLAIIPFFSLANLAVDFPVGFPDKSKLQYTTGIFEIQKSGESENYILLKNIHNNTHSQLFSCSYSPFSNGPTSSCGGLENLAPYVNKKVTIGWYEVDDFLGFKNDMPQLVTIEMDGRVMRSYAHTAEKVNTVKNDTIYLFLPGVLLFCCYFYWSTMRED